MKYKKIEEKIKNRIDYLGLTFEKLKEKIGLSKNDIIDFSNVSILEKIAITLEMNLGELIYLFNHNESLDCITYYLLESALDERDIELVINLFSNNRFLFINDDLYFINSVTKETIKVEKKILNKIFDLLLSNGYVNTVISYTTKHTLLDIKSLKDLDKYGDKVKELYLFGRNKESLFEPNKFVNLKEYFIDIYNLVSNDEREYLLSTVLDSYIEYEKYIKKRIKKGAYLIKLDNEYILKDLKTAYVINLFDFSSIKDNTSKIEKINETIDEMKRLVDKKYL